MLIMPSFQSRSKQLELLDDPSVSFEELQSTFKQIEFINRFTAAYNPTLSFIKKIYYEYHKNQQPNKALSILDAGCGHGDQLRAIYNWAAANDIAINLSGIDLSPSSKKSAEISLQDNNFIRRDDDTYYKAHTESSSISFHTGDIFDLQPSTKYDIVINSLMTHHLSDEMIIRLIEWMNSHSNYGWHINDLHRHPLAYYLIKSITASLPFNSLLKNDAPLSVARSFRYNDWLELIEASNIDKSKVDINWYWSFRYIVNYRH